MSESGSEVNSNPDLFGQESDMPAQTNEEPVGDASLASETPYNEQDGHDDYATQMQFLPGTAAGYKQAASLQFTSVGQQMAGANMANPPLPNLPTIRGDASVVIDPAMLYRGANPSTAAVQGLQNTMHQLGEVTAANREAAFPEMDLSVQALAANARPANVDGVDESGEDEDEEEADESAASTSAAADEEEEDDDDSNDGADSHWYIGQGQVPADVWALRNAILSMKMNQFGYPIRQHLKRDAPFRDHFTSNIGIIKRDSPLAQHDGDLRFWSKRFWLYLKTDHNGENLVNIPQRTLGATLPRWEDYEGAEE